jgi:hypothetical protein
VIAERPTREQVEHVVQVARELCLAHASRSATATRATLSEEAALYLLRRELAAMDADADD